MPYRARGEQRSYQATWMWRRRLTWIIENGPCKRCNSSVDLRVVYKDPKQRVIRVSSLWSLSDERRNRELKKCVVLCKVCAQEKRTLERQPEHGQAGRYDQGCRCIPCREAHRVKMADWRTKRRLKIAKERAAS